MSRYMFMISVSVVLFGCLMQQKTPKTTVQQSSQNSAGIFQLWEATGAMQLARADALFVVEQSSAALRTFDLIQDISFSRAARSVVAIQDNCQLLRESGSLLSASSQKLIPAGQVTFGLANQGDRRALTQKEDLSYELASLGAGVQPGSYTMDASGTPTLARVIMPLSMPDEWRGLRVQGVEHHNDTVWVSRNQGLNFSWEAPALTNDTTIISVQIIAQTETETSVLICAMLEKQAVETSDYTFSIPASMLSSLPATELARIDVVRTISLRAERELFSMMTRGRRSHHFNAILQ